MTSSIVKYGGLSTSVILIGVSGSFFILVWAIFSLLIGEGKYILGPELLVDFILFPFIVLAYHAIILAGILYDARKLPPFIIDRSYLKRNGAFLLLYGLGVVLFAIGHGLHWGGNIINLNALQFGVKEPFPDFYNNIWVIDEIWGHWVMLAGVWILVSLAGVLNLKNPSMRIPTRNEKYIGLMVAVLVAIAWIPLALEAEYGFWGLGISLFVIVTFGLRLTGERRKKIELSGNSEHNIPLTAKYRFIWLLLIFSLVSLIGLILLYLLLGGTFRQPSELGVWQYLRELVRGIVRDLGILRAPFI